MGNPSISAILLKEFDFKIGSGALSGIIRNSFYKGERKYADLIIPVPAIVSEDIWKKANDFINSRSKYISRKYVHTNLVQGKITCIDCDSIMQQWVNPNANCNQYRCKKCKNRVSRKWLNEVIRQVMNEHAIKTREVSSRKEMKNKIISCDARIESHKASLERLEKRRLKIQAAYFDDELADSDYNHHRDDIKKKQALIHTNISSIKEERTALKIALSGEIKHFSSNLEVFKTEIDDLLKFVHVTSDRIIINILGWREYSIKPPSYHSVGWKTRRGESIVDPLPKRFKLSDSDLDLMVNDYLNEKK